MTTAEIDNLQTQQDKDSMRIQVRHIHMHDPQWCTPKEGHKDGR